MNLRLRNRMKKLLVLIAAVLIAQTAHADCDSSLGNNFPGNQKNALCATFGSAIAGSLIPGADNTYDVGSSTLGWRTGYFDTSVITPLVNHATSLALGIAGTAEATLTNDQLAFSGTAVTLQSAGSLIAKVDADAQRLITFDASSDTAITQTFGDGGTTAAQTFTIGSATIDTDDDAGLCLTAADTCGPTRSAYVYLTGEQSLGDIVAAAPDDIFLRTGTGGVNRLTIDQAGTATFSGSVLVPGDTFPILNGAATFDADVTAYGTPYNSVDSAEHFALVGNGAADNGNRVEFLKTRSTGTDANTIVVNGDETGAIMFNGASGSAYVRTAAITSRVDGVPGAGNDMPGSLIFSTTPDGSGTITQALKLGQDQAAVFAQTITSTRTTDIGWVPVSAANQACNTTCTFACVTGIDTLGTGGFLACTDATADHCLCAGAS